MKRINVDDKQERKRLTTAFLNGFEHGVNTFKNNPINTNTRIPWSQIEMVLKRGMPKSGVKMYPASEETWFGICIGYLVGLLGFKSREILSNNVRSGDFIDFIKALKDKPEFYEMVRNVAIEWLTEMEEQKGTFSDRELRNYNTIKATI